MPSPTTTGGWRLHRTKANGSADTDWIGAGSLPADADISGMPFGADASMGEPTKLSVAVVVLDSSGDPLTHAGSWDMQLIELLPRTETPADRVAIGRETYQDVAVGDVQTWNVSGMQSFIVRLSDPQSLSGSLDSVEVWYRVERT